MGKELVYADGYAYPYASEAAEIKVLRDTKDWSPASIDFAAGAGGGKGVKTLADIVAYLGSKGDGTVTELGILGHANSTVFGLGGTIVPATMQASGDVTFDNTMLIDASSLAANAPGIQRIKAKFDAKARIVLYGCHAGLADSLLAAMAKAFGVCVYGFSQYIMVGFTTEGSPERITSRGHMYVDPTGGTDTVLGQIPLVKQWSKSVYGLTPDKASPGCPAYK